MRSQQLIAHNWYQCSMLKLGQSEAMLQLEISVRLYCVLVGFLRSLKIHLGIVMILVLTRPQLCPLGSMNGVPALSLPRVARRLLNEEVYASIAKENIAGEISLQTFDRMSRRLQKKATKPNVVPPSGR